MEQQQTKESIFDVLLDMIVSTAPLAERFKIIQVRDEIIAMVDGGNYGLIGLQLAHRHFRKFYASQAHPPAAPGAGQCEACGKTLTEFHGR